MAAEDEIPDVCRKRSGSTFRTGRCQRVGCQADAGAVECRPTFVVGEGAVEGLAIAALVVQLSGDPGIDGEKDGDGSANAGKRSSGRHQATSRSGHRERQSERQVQRLGKDGRGEQDVAERPPSQRSKRLTGRRNRDRERDEHQREVERIRREPERIQGCNRRSYESESECERRPMPRSWT